MRRGWAVLFLLFTLFAAPLTAQSGWSELLRRASESGRPIVLLFRPADCDTERQTCAALSKLGENDSLARRLDRVVFELWPLDGSPPASAYGSEAPGVALFDSSGKFMARWVGIPDAITLANILDLVSLAIPHLSSAAQLAKEGREAAYNLDLGLAFLKIGKVAEGRAALTLAKSIGSEEERGLAAIWLAMLDARERRVAEAIAIVEPLTAEQSPARVRIEALVALGDLLTVAGERERAAGVYRQAVEVAAPGSRHHTAALASLQALGAATASSVVEIEPPVRAVVSGRTEILARVSSTAVAKVEFLLDGKSVATVTEPPFVARVRFGRLPERRRVAVIAFDAEGRVLGRDELAVNESSDAFWVRIVAPEGAVAEGEVDVRADLQKPSSAVLTDLTFTWNDREVARLTGPPYAARVTIPDGELGVLAVTARLADGTIASDERVLNATGLVEEAGVHMVEVPVVMPRGEAPSSSDLIVVEDGKRRQVESVLRSAEAPLTVGIVIDSSSSMEPMMLDVQEAAVRFVESVMTERDRAFVVTFSTTARLIEPPTSRLARLKTAIMAIRPEGYTALHDAIVLGLMQFQTTGSRRALVVFTDGVDRTSRYRHEHVIETAKRVGAPVYIIAVTPNITSVMPPNPHIQQPTVSVPPEYLRAMRNLGAVARGSGGIFHEISSIAKLGRIYEEIREELDRQALVVYRTRAARKVDWRSLEVRIREGTRLRAPSGVYARPD
jgi:VWFA-related protein